MVGHLSFPQGKRAESFRGKRPRTADVPLPDWVISVRRSDTQQRGRNPQGGIMFNIMLTISTPLCRDEERR